MPSIDIVDMREELKESNFSMISKKLYREIENNLKNSEQTILFLNKVGHDSFTFCRSCGHVIKCEACDVAMTYHKNVDKLVCHYCGRTKNQVRICPVCHSKKIKEFGAGTEKLEEEVRNFFPNANILRMDSMTATNKNLYEMMYRDMKNNKIDILLGTQMIAKGLDFKNVSLVGVIIQTYRPDNFVIQAAKNNDYEAFYENELKLRRAFNYPPYKNILTIRVVNESRLRAVDISKKLYKDISKLLNNTSIELIGPNPCKIARINNKFRYNILIKVDDDGLNNVIDIINRLRIKYINKYKDTSFIPALNPTNIN